MVGPTRVGHYSREDYARLQKMKNEDRQILNSKATRKPVYSRNSMVEEEPTVNAGYRALNSLQMANNEHIVNSLFSKPIFHQGYGPTVDTMEDVNVNNPKYNLIYNRTIDLQSYGKAKYSGIDSNPEWVPNGQEILDDIKHLPVDTLDTKRTSTTTNPKPKVNGIMTEVGQRIIPSYPKQIVVDTNNTEHNLGTEEDTSRNIRTD